MPIKFDLENLRKEYNCLNYFETGLFDPTTNISCKFALACNFDKVYSIEIKKEWVYLGNEIFKKDIEDNRFNLYLDDSSNLEKYIMTDEFKNRTIFFLDAHVDDSSIRKFVKKRCPLLEELRAIKKMERKDNIILVDDLRILKTKFPWRERSYGAINFLEKIKKEILLINKNYKFSTLDGKIKDDVLLAYI